MATNSISALNTLRLSGLASGMDTESMVTSLMKAERMRYDKMVQQKTLMDWKKAANLEVNNLLRTFRDDYFSSTKPENNMLTLSSVLMNKVTMDASSSITITAGKDAIAGSHKINSITSLATGASAVSSDAVSLTGLSLDTKLSDLALSTPLTFDGDGNISFSINGKAFAFSSDDTLRTVIGSVNGDADAKVMMSYSSLTGKFSISSKTLGGDSSVVIQNLSGNAFVAGGAAFGIEASAYANGTDAVLNIDGVAVIQKANSFTIDGINYSLKDTSAAVQKFTVEQDIDGAVAKVKKFVDAYNTLIGKLSDKLDEERYTDYAPLTDDQRSGMSDKQVEQWEEKAKSGMLHNDSYISRLLNDLRRGFYDTVTSAGVSPSAVGLGTISYLTKGTIQIDETKLRQALQNNPQQVADALSGTSSAADPATKYKESGLAARLQTSINGYINDYNGYRTDSLNSQYKTLNNSMSQELRTLQNKEDRYWKQFNAMETALSKMNSQSSWLSQQFASN